MVIKNIRSVLLIMLAAALAMSVLTGCHDTAAKGNKEGAEEGNAAKGRYVEEDVKLPLKEGERALGVTKSKEGNVILFTGVNESEVRRYEYVEDQWKESSLDWAVKACGKEEGYLVDATETKDGVQFVIVKDDNQRTHIIRSADGKSGEDLQIPYLNRKTEIGYPNIIGILIDGGGNYWLQDIYQSKIIVISADTLEIIEELETMDMEYDSQKMMFLGADGTIAVNTEAGKYKVFNKDIKELGILSCVHKESESGQLCNDGKNWYMVSGEGITRMKAGDESQEILMDGSMGAMGSPVNSSMDMICGEDGQFYVLYKQWKAMTYSLARYVYDKDVAAVPEHTLQIFGLSENDTIRQAIIGFQRKNPDVKVEFKTSGKMPKDITSDDIRTLNTELLGKKGADVLLLNGLPADAYIEKGVLADLTEISKGLMKENTYLENMMKNTVRKDGKIYGIPIKFTVPVMYGDKQIEKALSSLDSLRSYLKKNPDAGIFGVTNKKYIRDFMFQMYQEELIKEDGSVDKAKMEQLLEISKEIVKNSKTDFFEGNDMEVGQDTLFAHPAEIYSIKHPDMVATGRVSNLGDMIIPCEIAREQNFSLKVLKDYYIPEGIAGINSNTEQKKVAEEFLRYLFSEEVQGAELDDGFPVLVSALDAKKQETKSEYAAVFSMSIGGNIAGEDISVSAGYPKEEEVEAFIGLCKTLNKPADQDRAVWDIYQNEADKVLDGSIKVKEGAESIRKKVELYLAE